MRSHGKFSALAGAGVALSQAWSGSASAAAGASGVAASGAGGGGSVAAALVFLLTPVLLLLGLWIGVISVGEQGRAEKARSAARKVLMAGEEILAEGLQQRAFAIVSRRVLLIITSSRVMAFRRGLLGGYRMEDIQWKDLVDARIRQNILGGLFGSNLRFVHSNGRAAQIAVKGIPNEVATEIYSRAQHEEQAWEEKRRVRSMEEVRAAAGGVVVHAAAPAAAPAASGNRLLDEISRAKALLDAGAISDAEFQEMKAKILAG